MAQKDISQSTRRRTALNVAVAALAAEAGFQRVEKIALETLTEILQSCELCIVIMCNLVHLVLSLYANEAWTNISTMQSFVDRILSVGYSCPVDGSDTFRSGVCICEFSGVGCCAPPFTPPKLSYVPQKLKS